MIKTLVNVNIAHRVNNNNPNNYQN